MAENIHKRQEPYLLIKCGYNRPSTRLTVVAYLTFTLMNAMLIGIALIDHVFQMTIISTRGLEIE